MQWPLVVGLGGFLGKEAEVKKPLILSLFVLSAKAMAASVPSSLPDGKYKMECQTISIEKYEPPTPRSTDTSGVVRRVESQSGTAIYLTSGDLTTIKEVYSTKGDGAVGRGEDFIQKTVKEIGEHQFEETASVTSSFTLSDAGFTKQPPLTEVRHWTRTFSVKDNFEINLKIKSGDEPELLGRSETVVSKNADGSYNMFSYLREGYHLERKEIKSGVFSSAKYIYQANSICRYAPVK